MTAHPTVNVHLAALEFDAQDPSRLAAFWAALLHRDPVGAILPALTVTDFDVRFVAETHPKTERHRMHFDLASSSLDDQQGSVEKALSLGATQLDVGQRPDERHVVLADPEDNEFCIVEADNRFLADTARLGAVAGEGMPIVGYFWSQALSWPLVWDQDEETAIQAPTGGPKISWGGPPVPSKTERNRLRWVLTAEDLPTQIERLYRLGATVLNRTSHRADLTDPEGNEFSVELAS